MSVTLADKFKGRDNNFNLIRFIAAALVLYSHSFDLYGWKDAEPLRGFDIGMSFGQLAVDVFFFTSGLLIAGSYYARNNIKAFTKARVLRIYPALIVAVLFTVGVIGLYFTPMSAGEYFTEKETWKYVERNTTLVANVKFTLPGVFDELPFLTHNAKGVVNGSLWTLPYEIKSYFVLALIAMMLGWVQKKKQGDLLKPSYLVLAILGVSLYAANQFISISDSQGLRLYPIFFLGACTYIWRDKIKLNHVSAVIIVLSLIISASLGRQAFQLVYIIGFPLLILYLAYIPGGVIRGFNKLGDYSYGVYIYAFPIQQSVLALHSGDISFSTFIIYSSIATLVLAILSWHLVEKRCLKFRRHSNKKPEADQVAVG